MDILVILQTALLYVIRGILEFLNQEGMRLAPGNISYVQNQVMDKLQDVDVLKNFSDQALLQNTVHGILLDNMVMVPEDIVPRASWKAAGPKSQKMKLAGPLKSVVVHHSNTGGAVVTPEDCMKHMKELQEHHMDKMNKSDIMFNFVLCGDGTVLEGTGWDVDTDHAPELGQKSLGVSFLGESTEAPSNVSLKLLELLLQDGVNQGKLSPDYKLLTHSQLKPTDCPGKPIESAIRTLQHWTGEKPPATPHKAAIKTGSEDV